MTEITIILGTRPEIIKLAPVIRECEQQDIPFSIIHTGQHYSDELDTVFFDQLELPSPDCNLEVGSGSHGAQTGEMIAKIEKRLLTEQPDVVLVQGDTNSVLAGAIATSKLDIELGHVEAGLRSFDREMPEETNRVLADHAADYLFAPTEDTVELLEKEGISESRIFNTGNTIVDSVHEHKRLADRKSDILDELGMSSQEFVLLTAHRAENVDEKARFASILEGVDRFASKTKMDVVYPIHPRAQEKLDRFDIRVPDSIQIVPPQDFLDFLTLEANAAIIFTDSGGVQEEACILGTPCVTVRDNTERPETIDVGSNHLVGTDPETIVTGGEKMLEKEPTWENPFGDGKAAGHILEVLSSNQEQIESADISEIDAST